MSKASSFGRAAIALLALAIGGRTALYSEPSPIAAAPFFAALSVADAEASADWYGRVFGYTIHRSIDVPERGVRIRLMHAERGFVELIELESAVPLDERLPDLNGRYQVHGIFKIGVRVADLDLAIERLEELGVALRGEVITEEDGSMRFAQVEDLDGNIIQIFEELQQQPVETMPEKERSP